MKHAQVSGGFAALVVVLVGCWDSFEHEDRGSSVAGSGGAGSGGGGGGAGTSGTGGAGTGGTGGTGGTAGELSAEEFSRRVLSLFCAQRLTCTAAFGSDLGTAVLGTSERCLAYHTDFESLTLEQSVAEGRVFFDAARAEMCLTEANDAPCESFSLYAPPERDCDGIVIGNVAIGGECRADDECSGDAFCARNVDRDGCVGTCTARPAPGSACESTAILNPCSQSTGYVRCDNNRCVAHPVRRGATAGEDCGTLPDGQVVVCQLDLWCSGALTAQPGTCREAIPVGDPCEPGSYCAGRSTCDSGVCREVSVQTQVGDACNGPSRRTQVCDPLAGLICVNGQCAAAAPGIENGPCTRDDLSGFNCQDGLYCDVMADRCLPKKSTGEPCVLNRECLVQCDTLTQRCLAEACDL